MLAKQEVTIVSLVLLTIWPSDMDKFKLGGVDAVTWMSEPPPSNGRQQSLSTAQTRALHLFDRFHNLEYKFFHTDHDGPEISNDISANNILSPIILLPGYGGSRLEAKRNKNHTEHYFCEAQSDWTNFWIDVKQLLPYMIDCLIEDFRLEFDPLTNRSHDTDGVQIRVKDPDNISSVEYLNDFHLPSFAYFANLIHRLTTNLGYKRNVNIRGAPYDFRKAPNELGDYFKKLKLTSEQMFNESNEIPITFVCHSMGCNNILYFLQNQSQHWKDQYVKRVISIAAPWAGSLSALRATALGDNLGMPYLFDEAKLNRAQRSLPSTIYLFPHIKAFEGVPLIRSNIDTASTNSNNSQRQPSPIEVFHANNYKHFFDKIHHPDGYRIWLNTKDLLGSLEAPGVEVWCLYGENQRTLGRLEFSGDFPESEEMDLYDNGDGTVTIQSSKFCRQWANEQSQPVHLKGFSTTHIDILKNSEVLATIESIIQNDYHVVCDQEEDR